MEAAELMKSGKFAFDTKVTSSTASTVALLEIFHIMHQTTVMCFLFLNNHEGRVR